MFLDCTGISELTISAKDPVAAAQAEQVLQHCAGIRILICSQGFTRHLWPPSLEEIVMHRPGAWDDMDDDAEADLQHLQLVCLQGAAHLRQLTLHTGIVSHWPASLKCALPASLQKVIIGMDTFLFFQGDTLMIDFSAFTLAAGCHAALQVKADADTRFDDDEDPAKLIELISVLTAVPSFSSFTLGCMDFSVEHLGLLEQVQCDRLTLTLYGSGCNMLTWLPAVQHLTVIFDWLFAEPVTDAPVFDWAALASPGLRCLGSAEAPMHQAHSHVLLWQSGCACCPLGPGHLGRPEPCERPATRVLQGGGFRQTCVAQCSCC